MKRIFATAGLFCSLLVATTAFSQSRISGTVNDASGALIPGVTVTATNAATAVATTVLSNETGAYNFASLPPGTYKLTAELPGFQGQAFDNVVLGQSDQLRFNFKMTVSTVAQTVEVSVDARRFSQRPTLLSASLSIKRRSKNFQWSAEIFWISSGSCPE